MAEQRPAHRLRLSDPGREADRFRDLRGHGLPSPTRARWLVTVAVPGVAQPVAIVDTHLNSLHAARVSYDRSFYAYQRQVDALSEFVRANIPAGRPFIVRGRFHCAGRGAGAIICCSGRRPGAATSRPRSTCASRRANQCPTSNRQDLEFSHWRGRDYQLFASGGLDQHHIEVDGGPVRP